MKKQIVDLLYHDRKTPVPGYVSNDFPGLALHQNEDRGYWVATHIASGLAVGTLFGRRRDAQRFATAASQVLDFAVSTNQLNASLCDVGVVRNISDLEIQCRNLSPC